MFRALTLYQLCQVAEDPNDQEALLHTGIVRNRRESNSEHNGQVSSSATSSLDEEGVNDSTLVHQQKEEAKNVNFYETYARFQNGGVIFVNSVKMTHVSHG